VQAIWASAAVRETLAIGFLIGVVLFSFRAAIRAGLIAFEKDTLVFFYPLESWFAREFQAGRFPLWNPLIFAGYPALADGEGGLAYPLHLLLLRLLSAEQAFIWLRVSSVLIAALSLYALCRALGLGRIAGVVGGLAFGMGSFFVSQQHHENVMRTAAWLPLVLALTEWSLHRAGWRRHLLLTGAGVALAMSALGLHPQVLGMSLLGFSAFVVYRVLVCDVGSRESASRAAGSERTVASRRGAGPAAARIAWGGLQRVALTAWIGCYVVFLGLGLASVQLVPLAELGAATYRGSQPEYFFATSYALPMQNLINLLLPYFFRGPEAEYWSLWARWETALYVGIVPLVLGVVGAILARRREVWFFLVLALAALWLAFATYAPFDLYALLWQLPGFSAFRVPGRYTYLFLLGWSVLAAFGLHALSSAEVGPGRARRLAALAVVLLLGGGLAALTLGGLQLRSTLLADPAGAASWINASYLSLRHHPAGIATADVYAGLVHSLDPGNPRTAFGTVMAICTLALVAGLLVTRRAGILGPFVLVGLATVDLLLFGASFHRQMPVSQLADRTPAIAFLSDRGAAQPPRQSGADWRVYTPGESVPEMEFNRLVPFGVEDIGGYSSAEPREHFAFWTTVHSLQNRLLDIANVRYLVLNSQTLARPSYRNVPFDPERPLMLGSRGSIGGIETYSFEGERGHRVQVIAALTRALEIPQGEPVAELTIYPVQGAPVSRQMRAGVHVSEWAYDRPDIVNRARHERPPEIAFRRPDTFQLDGSRYELLFSYAEFDLPQETQVDRVEIRYVHERGGMELYGLGLYNFDTRQTTGVSQEQRRGQRVIYRDPQVRIIERPDAFPRAYVVPSARVAPHDRTALSAMLDTPFDPTQEVMLDASAGRQTSPGHGTTPGQARAGARMTPAEVREQSTDRVVIRASAPEGGYLVHVASYFPGWRARVDGQDAPVLPANALFRAVPLSPGDHTVELRYEAETVRLGLAMTIWAACGGIAVVLGALMAAQWAQRRPRRAS
jgi:hypothetical protein